MIEHLTLRRAAKLFEQVDTETGAMALLEQIHALRSSSDMPRMGVAPKCLSPTFEVYMLRSYGSVERPICPSIH